MVRVRFYQLTLSLPFILVMGSLAMTFMFDSGYKAVFLALGSGVALQLVFALIPMPKVWKVPLCNWTVNWSFRLRWQAYPGYKMQQVRF